MAARDSSREERRRYIRLDTVFPVAFRLLSCEGLNCLSDLLQGFTNNIGKGGICLIVNNLDPVLEKLIKSQQAKFSLEIELPFSSRPIQALAKPVWVRDVSGSPGKYIIGLGYEQIDPLQNSKIMRYARAKKIFVPLVSCVIIILGVAFFANTYLNIKLIKGNKALVEQLIKIMQDSSLAKQKVKQINKEKEDLQLKMQALELRIETVEDSKNKLEESAKLEEKKAGQKMEELNALIGELAQEKSSLQEGLIALQYKENAVTEDLLRLDKRKATLTQANLNKMYQWLKVHQNPRTGLLMSFEGDNNIADWAFIYDQALVAQAFTYFSDFERAKKILEFFKNKAKTSEGRFYNAYYANDGSPAEYAIHSGPNIWLGIAALHYVQKAKDHQFLKLAEDIAAGVISLQRQDKDNGIRGGPDVEWYATEHNLDAYAFFNMLYKLTGKKEYGEASDKILSWLAGHTYDKADIPIKRGKGDSTIATDTYAWSVAAIGPKRLEEIGMNPDRIMEFAEEACAVQVQYIRPEGQTIKIKGFDFAPQRHVGRGGVVSSEWSSQMILSFKIMADFYYKKNMIAKARSYELKANEYLSELANMIISSPSPSGQGESCLPYATEDVVDTGHGWVTPKGKSTGSVSGTTYTLFAYYNYNPLELAE